MSEIPEWIKEECKRIVEMDASFKQKNSPFSVDSVTIDGQKFSMEQIKIIAQEKF